MSKPKVAIYWAAACGGCDTKILDIDEKILDVAAAVDLVFWPIAMDFKYKDVEAMADGEIDLCVINGGVRNSEQEHIVKLLRRKSKVVAALGACAISGGIPALANLHDADGILDYVYRRTASMESSDGVLPQTEFEVSEGTLTLPTFYDSVFAVPQVIEVEYFIPGCPPPPELIAKALELFAAGGLPPAPAVVAGDKSVCDECPRQFSGEVDVTEWKRVANAVPDPERCFLEQGFICMGPATRSGCGALCPKANMPCEGCMGKAPDVLDRGGKMASVIGALGGAKTEEEAERLAGEVADPVGLFWRFDLPISLMKGKVSGGQKP